MIKYRWLITVGLAAAAVLAVSLPYIRVAREYTACAKSLSEAEQDKEKQKNTLELENAIVSYRQRELHSLVENNNARAKEYEKDIDSLYGSLLSSPLRVRYETTKREVSGCVPPKSSSTPTPPIITERKTTASGVLPAENSRRLAETIKEVERLNLAYGVCLDYTKALEKAMEK